MFEASLLLLFSQPMDQSSLKNSDVLILTGLTQMPTANPDGMLGEFCSNLGRFRLKNPEISSRYVNK